MAASNVVDLIKERLKRGLGYGGFGSEHGGSGGGDDEPPKVNEISARLSKLEGAYDALKVVRPMTLVVISLVLAVMIGPAVAVELSSTVPQETAGVSVKMGFWFDGIAISLL